VSVTAQAVAMLHPLSPPPPPPTPLGSKSNPLGSVNLVGWLAT
jgi:hypothetical protein